MRRQSGTEATVSATPSASPCPPTRVARRVVAYTRAKRVSDRECLFDIALNHAQRLIRKSLQPHHSRQGYTRGHPLFELKADDVRAVTGAHIAAEHTLYKLPRTRLIAQKMQHDTHHPITDVRVGRIGTVHCEGGEAFCERKRLAILAVVVAARPQAPERSQ